MLQPRLDKLRKTLKEKRLDAFLVSNSYNILYLSGFKTLTDNEREAWLFITAKNSYLFSDSRYLSFPPRNMVRDKLQRAIVPLGKSRKIDPPVKPEDDGLERKLITPENSLIKHLKRIIVEEKIRTLGIEGEDLKINEFNKLKQELRVEVVPTERLIIKQREIKDGEEIEKIRKACQIGDECLTEIVKTIKIGQTEKEIAFRIEFWLKEKGFDLAFYPIVSVDANSAVPHYDTKSGNNKKVKKRSIILIDFGAKYQDYLSDITRMVFVGKPKGEILNTYNHLLDTQTKTIQKLHLRGVRQGVAKLKEVDSFCREKLNYPHSTGHGVGLEIHEYPKISITSADILLPNQVVTIEPGVYFEGKWGVRIEDTVVVKKKGVEILTKFSKQLLTI